MFSFNSYLKTLAAFFFIVILFTQCKKEQIDVIDCSGVTPTYDLNVKGIMSTNCAISGCHNATTKKHGIDLSTYDGTRSAGGDKSFLGAIQHKSGYTKMPKGASKLPDADIKTITCWVQNGMPQ